MMRLQKFLSQAGIASRRKAEELILAGKIKINGQVADRLGTTVDEMADEVEYLNKKIGLPGQKVYIALNKPAGYITSTASGQGKSVLDLVKMKGRIYPAGRLDKDSSGLLILTNDGEFANLITHPRFGGQKEYFVVLDRDLQPKDTEKLQSGFALDGQRLKPVKIAAARNKSCRLILTEGINRQIRRMLGRLGYTVVKLKRIRIGKLELGALKEGQWKKIKKEDVI